MARLARAARCSSPTPRARGRRDPRWRARAGIAAAHAPLDRSPSAPRSDDVARARALARPTRTCCSSRAAARAGRRASCSRTARTGCAASRACSATSPSARVCMFPLFHMAALHTGARRLADARRDRIRALAHARGAARARSRGGGPTASTASRSSGRASWPRTSGATTSSSLRELDTGTSATPLELIRALKQRFPGTRTRIYYGSTEAGSAATLPDAEVLREAGQRRTRRARRRAAPHRGGRDLRAQPVPDGRLLRRRRGDGRRAARRLVPHGRPRRARRGRLPLDRGPHEGRDPQRRRERLARGGGGRARRMPRRARGRRGRPPRSRSGASVVCAVVVPEPGAAPTLEALRAHCEGRSPASSSPRRLELLDALPRTAATGQVQRALLVERIATGT